MGGYQPAPGGMASCQAGKRVVKQVEVQRGDDDGDEEHQGTGQAAVGHVFHGVAVNAPSGLSGRLARTTFTRRRWRLVRFDGDVGEQ